MSGAAGLGPWAIYVPLREPLYEPSIALAKARAGRVYDIAIFVRIEHQTTGESWARRAGRWVQEAAARPGHLVASVDGGAGDGDGEGEGEGRR